MSALVFPSAATTSLLIIDVQERLVPAMHAAAAQCIRTTSILLECAIEFQWPVFYTEQFPRGLGPTIEPLRVLLEQAGAQRQEKTEFSALNNADFAAAALPRLTNHVIVCGMESHICVLQTVVDLQARGHQAYVPIDGVASRTEANRDNGLALMARAGAVVTNAESLLFGAVGRAGRRFSRSCRPMA